MLAPKRLTLAIAIGIVGVGIAGTSIAQEAYELRPNMRIADAFDLRLFNDGTLLKFSTMSCNIGEGPLQIEGGESSSNIQNVYQRVSMSDGSSYQRMAGLFQYHPEHNHVHFEKYANYTLQPVNAPGGSKREGQKTSFCLMDTDVYDRSLPGAPNQAQYDVCDTTIQGISVGWCDTYRWYLVGQDIDVTGLPSGDYKLTMEVDPDNRLLETDDTDNTSTIYVNLDLVNSVVTVIDEPGNPPDPQVTVSGITPDSTTRDSAVRVTITGAGFAQGMPISFENGSGQAPVLDKISYVDSATVMATVLTKKGGPKRLSTWDLRVGNGVLANAFTVYPK